MHNATRFLLSCSLIALFLSSAASAQSRQAPPGMFKDLNDEIAGDAILIHGKQLFIDDYIIGELDGATKTRHQPIKHPKNPLMVPDKPWEGSFGYSSVIFDQAEGTYKMWYAAWSADQKKQSLCYATSADGIEWRKPLTMPSGSKEQSNVVFGLTHEFNCAGVFKDPADPDPMRRYKMMYSDYPDKTAKTASTSVAFSPDGIHWTPHPKNPLIPFSDSHNCPFWDVQRNRYVAYLRFGPPNDRIISRIESEDFDHWSPKLTVLRAGILDQPFSTVLYQMEVLPYQGMFLGLISTYHGETIKPIPENETEWKDKLDVQLAFSRNGVTWSRVVDAGWLKDARDKSIKRSPESWKRMTTEAAFIPFGEHGRDWDWGAIYPLQGPVVIGDEIRIYYTGHTGRHWGSYHGDKDRLSGIGVATLRLDGFVSFNAGDEAGTLTTKPLVFIGDTLVVNANAAGGSLTVEALDAEGKAIEGFGIADCTPITTDSVRHVLKWKDNPDCHLLQARPIKLRFHLKNAKLYAFEPRIRHNHYLQSYD